MNNIKGKLANISLYDVKAYVRKAQNAVYQKTEMEAKVREATNNEPWGASSSLMEEIAEGTFSYEKFNEIMPMVFKRFTEKSAEAWRQVYKGLQLLEYLVKNGSERVIDYARTNLDIINMLQHFQYISPDGRDQGANVRTRAKELYNLLSDVNKIRSERKVAKTRRERGGKHSRGFGSVSGISYGGSNGYDTDMRRNSINGGFGGYSGGVYGDGGGFEESSGRYDSDNRRSGFQEYEVDIPEVNNANSYVPSLGRSNTARVSRTSSRKETPPPQASKQVDLFSFDDEQPVASQTPAGINNNNNAFNPVAAGQDDEFDDFQSAGTTTVASTTPAVAAATTSQKSTNNILDLFNTSPQTTFNTNAMPSYNSPITPMGNNNSHNRTLSMMPLGMQSSPATSSATRPAAANYSHNRSFSTMSSTATNGLSGSAGIGSNSGSAGPKNDDAFSSIWASTKGKPAATGSKPAAPQESLI